MLEAALAELVESGVEATTMLSVARRAEASKETLYSWFGNREGLLRAVIQHNADGSAERVRAALDAAIDDDADPVDTLVAYAANLLRLLTADGSVALNRAAMVDRELAADLLESGRHRVGPLVERYLARLSDSGRLPLTVPPGEAFTLLYGLVIEDTQIRVLLGEAPPDEAEIARRADVAVERFVRLAAPDSLRGGG